MTVSAGELLANVDADVTDVTAPVRLATNILKDGESNELREYYVKRGDTIYMYIAVNEELAHNPTFTLINNGKEYVMEDSLVTVRQTAEDRWDYSVKYDIPEDTTFVDGEITLRVSDIEDVAGNSIPDENGPTNGHRVFYDGTAPRIIVKGTENINEPDEQYVGDATQKIFSKVSFKFNDNLMLKGEYEVNDTLITGMTPATWGDANFSVIEKYLVQGLNKITTWDMAGNEVTYEFTYDSIAPVYSKLGILNKTRYVNDVKDVTYAKRGDEVRILISFPERLAVEPTVKVFGKEYTATYRPLSSNPEQNIYYYMVDFTLDETMPEGEIPFEVYGYADIAGNVGEKLDQTRINRDEYPRVIYDRTKPVVKLEGTGVNNYFRSDVIITAEDANLGTIHLRRNGELVKNYELGTPLTEEGNYEVVMSDKAGNKSEQINFTIDKTVPVITLEGTGVNNNFRTDVKATIEEENVHNIKYKKDDERWITVNEKELTFTEEGTYTVEVIDLAYNRTEVTFTIDKTAPALRELRVQNFYNPTGNQNYSGLTQNPGQNKGIAITVNTTELLAKNPIIVVGGKEIEVPVQEPQYNKYVVYVDLTEDMDLVEGEKIPVTVKGLVDLAGNTGDEVTTTGNDNYYVIFDRTAPKTLANNILKLGESNEQREYYVRPGDSIYMCYTANEELGHNPTFTLINNGKEYVMEDSQVIVKQNPAKAWDYTVIYEIPEDTTFVDGEIELKVSNIEDKAGNKREDVNGPTNGHKVYFDTTAPEKLNLGIARNTNSEDTRDQRYAKAGDSIRVLVSFPEKLAVEPKVEMFGKVYDVTYRPDSSVEESNIYYYMADVKIEENTPEGEVAFKVYGYKDVAENEGEPLTNANINDGKYTNVIIDNTKPTIEPTEDSISGSEGNYSRIGFKVTDNNGVASYEINGETLILTNGEISYEALKSYLKEGANTVVASDEAGNTAKYTFNYDATPAVNLAVNILKNGETNEKAEYYVKPGDKIYMYIAFGEKLANNPTFTLINNNNEYTLPDELVNVTGPKGDNNRYDYSVVYEIPKDTTFVEGEITLKISNLIDMYGNTIENVTKPTNGHKVYFDNTKPKITGVTDGTFTREDVKLYAEDANVGTIHLNIKRPGKTDYEQIKNYEWGTALTEDGEYSVYLSDKAGNKSETINFVIDKTVPKIEGPENNKYYNEPVSVKIVEENIQNVKVFVDGNSKGKEIDKETTFTADGTYFIRVTDKAYNKKAEITFTIDMTKPAITGVANNSYYRKSVTPNVTDKNIEKVTLTKDGKEIAYNVGDTLSEEGKYVLTATDKANNTEIVTFTIDTSAPKVTIEGEQREGIYYGTVTVRIDEKNIKTSICRRTNGGEWSISDGDTLSTPGDYHVHVVDLAHNKHADVYFTIGE